ncbi:MAG: hypothetical protein AAF639_42835 [Chloroflexota bacterium]
MVLSTHEIITILLSGLVGFAVSAAMGFYLRKTDIGWQKTRYIILFALTYAIASALTYTVIYLFF